MNECNMYDWKAGVSALIKYIHSLNKNDYLPHTQNCKDFLKPIHGLASIIHTRIIHYHIMAYIYIYFVYTHICGCR